MLCLQRHFFLNLEVFLPNVPKGPKKMVDWNANKWVVDLETKLSLILDEFFRYTLSCSDTRNIASWVVGWRKLTKVEVLVKIFLDNVIR